MHPRRCVILRGTRCIPGRQEHKAREHTHKKHKFKQASKHATPTHETDRQTHQHTATNHQRTKHTKQQKHQRSTNTKTRASTIYITDTLAYHIPGTCMMYFKSAFVPPRVSLFARSKFYHMAACEMSFNKTSRIITGCCTFHYFSLNSIYKRKRSTRTSNKSPV